MNKENFFNIKNFITKLKFSKVFKLKAIKINI